ncbi:MAG: hypothetical protein ACOYK8_08065 [Alphaproteobacteria bacterium]
MSDAMRLVREALGDDAVIISTKDMNGQGFQVTAALDEDVVEYHQPEEEAAARFTHPAFLQQQAVGLYAHATHQHSGDDVLEQLAATLFDHGSTAPLTERVISSLFSRGAEKTHDVKEALQQALKQVFQFKPLTKGKWVKPLILIGPPGAGKTVMVARLATQAVIAGLKPVTITADMQRAGGIDQLQKLADILRISCIAVNGAQELGLAVSANRGADRLIIDAPGINPFSGEDLTLAAQLIKATHGEALLVLPAGGDVADCADMAAAFASLGIKRMAVTRMDIARRLGGVLAASMAGEMALADFSASARVQDAPQPFSANILARMLLRLPLQDKSPARQMQDMLAKGSRS